MKPPDSMMRSNAERSTMRSLTIGNAVARHKFLKRRFSARIFHAATNDDDGALCLPEQRSGGGEVSHIGFRRTRVPYALSEEGGGPCHGFRLHILREGQRDGAAFGGISQHPHGGGQSGQQLFGPRDAIEIA